MQIKQFPYKHETLGVLFGYLLYSGNEGLLIDPNSPDEIETFCRKNNLTIKTMSNTHLHHDHIIGNEHFISKGINYISPVNTDDMEEIAVGNEKVQIIKVPGHSADSVAFYCKDILVSGDTIFNGTIGNCFTGDYSEYFKSLSKVISLPENTEIYPGHDLMDYAVGVIREIDPENPETDKYLMKVKTGQISSTIEMELQVNPFVRWDDQSLDSFRAKLDLPISTPLERFKAMMSVH